MNLIFGTHFCFLPRLQHHLLLKLGLSTESDTFTHSLVLAQILFTSLRIERSLTGWLNFDRKFVQIELLNVWRVHLLQKWYNILHRVGLTSYEQVFRDEIATNKLTFFERVSQGKPILPCNSLLLEN